MLEISLDKLVLSITLQILQLVALQIVGVKSSVFSYPLLQVLSEKGNILSFLYHIIKCLLLHLTRLLHMAFVLLSLDQVLPMPVDVAIVGVLVHLSERTIVR